MLRRSLPLFLAASVLTALPALAQTQEHRALVDLDNDPATGCTFATAEGPFDGAEVMVITTVTLNEVTAVEQADCVGGVFDPPVPLMDFPPPWDVGVGFGTNGTDVVETYLPLAAPPAPGSAIRVGFDADDGGSNSDALLTTDGSAGGPPILVTLGTVLDIPTLSPVSLILLGLLLAVIAGRALRRRRGMDAWLVLFLACGLAAGGLWAVGAITPDGDPSDWTGAADASADDPFGDGNVPVDLRAGFAALAPDSAYLFLRVDVARGGLPTAVDDSDVITEDDPATTIDVLANDLNPGGMPLTITAVTQPPGGTVVITNGGADLTYQPDPDFCNDGTPTDDFTYTLDPGGTVATVAVTVVCVDDPPSITAVADQSIFEDGTTGPLAFTVADVDTAVGSLVVTAASNDQALIPDGNLALAVDGAGNGTITATPAADQNGGPATITVTVDDGTTAVPETFDVTVTPINDEPSFTAGADESVAEDAGPQTVAGWATAIDDGDPEVVQMLTFQVTNDNNALFSQQPAVDAAGTLTYTSAADASGSATVSVTLMDDGGTVNPGDDDTSPTQTFTVTVSGVNDPPSHAPGGGTAMFVEDGGAVVVDNGITLSDPDSTNLASATLTLGILDAGLETLAANTGGTSISAVYNGGTGVLSLTGSDTLANYQAVLRSITYNNTDQDPDTTTRTITCVVNDGSASSPPANLAVAVTAQNDPPMVTNATITYAAIGHTLLRVDGADADNHDVALPGRIASSVDLVDAATKAVITDVDDAVVGFMPKLAEATDQGGSITLDDDGDFFYLPPVGFTGTDTETLMVTDGVNNVPVTLEITVTDLVWFVEDTTGPKNPAGGDGRSTDAFETLAAAEAASGPGHIILLFETDAPLDEGISLKSGQRLYGQRVEEEPVSLLPAGLLLEEIADTDARPQIHRTNGAAVTVDASGATLTGVEIRHLDLQSGDDDGISVTTGGTNVVDTLLIDENVIGGAGARGIDVDAAHTAGTATIEIRDNQITSTQPAIDVADTAGGVLAVAINGNTNLVSTGSHAVQVTGSTVVTSLAGNTVGGDTSGAGMLFTSTTFDADPGAAGFQLVNAGNTVIGSAANRVGTVGLSFSFVTGDLSFGDLDIESDGAGILGVGSAEINAGAGTGFRLATGAGSTVTAMAGSGLNLANPPMTANVTLASMTSAGAGNGVLLNNVAGTVNIQGGSITTSTAEAFRISQGVVTNPLNVTYSGTITNTADHMIEVDGYPNGTLTFNGTSLSDSGAAGNTGSGMLFNNVGAGATVNVSATTTTITQSDGNGIAITGDSDGTINIDNTTITDAAGRGIFISDGPDRLNGTFDFDNVDVSQAGNGRLLEIQGLNTGGSVNFDAASTLSATDGTGILISSNAGNGSVTLSGPVDLGTGASRIGDGQAFTMSANSAGTTVAIPDLDVFTSGQTAVGASGSGTLDLDALSIDTASNGRGLDLTGIVSAVDVDSIACSNSSACVNLTSLAATSVTTFTGMALTCSGGTCFNASSARTVEATGTTNDIDATGAVGLHLAGTTIGANDFILRSVDASGAANGIVLNDTGTDGNLHVTGNGSTVIGAGTGGVITGTTGAGVLLTDTMGPILNNVNITSTGFHGLFGTRVNGFELRNSLVDQAGDADEEHGVFHVNLTGTSVITNSTVNRAANDLVRVNNTDTSATLSVIGSNFPETIGGGGFFGNDAISFQVQGTSGGTLNVNGNRFGDHSVGGVSLFGNAVDIGNSTGGAVAATGTLNLNADNNTSDQNPGDLNKAGNFKVSGQDSLTVNIDWTRNNFIGAKGNGILAIDTNDSSTVQGTIGGPMGMGNTITNATNSNGITLLADESSTLRVIVEGNMLTNVGTDGIQIANFGSTAGQSTDMDVVLRGNTVDMHNGGATPFIAGIDIFGGGAAGGGTCLVFDNNTVLNTPGGFFDYSLDDFGAPTGILVQGPGMAAVTAADVQALNMQPGASVNLFGAVNFSNGAACATPP